MFGVSVDQSNSNPVSAVTYTDDAVGMTGGSTDWDSLPIFKDIKPCMLKDGAVQYYLDPNDFSKKADGTAADITSGADGDVMIEFPKVGLAISTVDDLLTVRITDNPADVRFHYYAHTRESEGDRDKLYIGAYLDMRFLIRFAHCRGKRLRQIKPSVRTGRRRRPRVPVTTWVPFIR